MWTKQVTAGRSMHQWQPDAWRCPDQGIEKEMFAEGCSTWPEKICRAHPSRPVRISGTPSTVSSKTLLALTGSLGPPVALGAHAWPLVSWRWK